MVYIYIPQNAPFTSWDHFDSLGNSFIDTKWNDILLNNEIAKKKTRPGKNVRFVFCDISTHLIIFRTINYYINQENIGYREIF